MPAAIQTAQTVFAVDSAVATATPKVPSKNQDRARTVLVPDGAAAVVCDGVGSFEDSGDVAERCVSVACGHIGIEGVWGGILTCPVAAALLMANDIDLPEGATTLLSVGADRKGRGYFSIVGNGSILTVEPLSVRESRAHLLVGDLVLPHSEIIGSQTALRSFLPAPAHPVEETAGVLMPRHGRPRLLLACSDGIATAEERMLGHNEATGEVWVQREPPFAALLTALELAWGELVKADDAGAFLGATLQGCLDLTCERGLLADDATVAAVFVRPATASETEAVQ